MAACYRAVTVCAIFLLFTSASPQLRPTIAGGQPAEELSHQVSVEAIAGNRMSPSERSLCAFRTQISDGHRVSPNCLPTRGDLAARPVGHFLANGIVAPLRI